MSDEKPKGVRITTLQDLVDVATPENYQSLMKDLSSWLYFMLLVKAVGAEVKNCAMDWTDDGINELTGWDISVRKKT